MQVRPECSKVSDTIKSIVERAGLRGMARGLGITICREVPAFGLYFSSYELLVQARKNNTAWVFAAGGFAGTYTETLPKQKDGQTDRGTDKGTER